MSKELKESKKLEKFIEEMRKKKHDVTYNHNDDLLKDIETVLQALKNSIPKEVIEKKIAKLKKHRDLTPFGTGKIIGLQELLEKNK